MNPVKYIKSMFTETVEEKLYRVFGYSVETRNNTYYCYNLNTEFTLTDSEVQSIENGDYKNCLEVVKAKLGEEFFAELDLNKTEEYWSKKINELIPELQLGMPKEKALRIIYEKLSNKSAVR